MQRCMQSPAPGWFNLPLAIPLANYDAPSNVAGVTLKPVQLGLGSQALRSPLAHYDAPFNLARVKIT